MNWYHRDESRYVEYGSSFSASRQFGVLRSLTDTVYRMNSEHLSHDVETVFESLDDADVRTAGTTYLIYRGRHEHEVAQESALARIVTSTLFRRTILGPKELFYADLYASRKTGCKGQLGPAGRARSAHRLRRSFLVEHDLFDFMLFSLPDNDAWSHRNGPHAQVTSMAAADRQLERLFHAGGGADQFLADTPSSSARTTRRRRSRSGSASTGRSPTSTIATPSACATGRARRGGAQPGSALGDDLCARSRPPASRSSRRSLDAIADIDGVDLAMWLDGGRGGDPRPSRRAALRPGGELQDLRGERWSVEGDSRVLRAEIQDGRLFCTEYPDPLGPGLVGAAAAAMPATSCCRRRRATSSWTGAAPPVGGGSHGSLHRSDSLATLLWCGTGPDHRASRDQWSLRDITPMVRNILVSPRGRRRLEPR